MASEAERGRPAGGRRGELPLAARQAAWRRVWDALLRPRPEEGAAGAGPGTGGPPQREEAPSP